MLHIAIILCQHNNKQKPRTEAYLQVRGGHAPHICRHEGQYHQQDEQADRQEQQQRRWWGQWRQHQRQYEQWNGEASEHEECLGAKVVRRDGLLVVSNICPLLLLLQMPLCSIWSDYHRIPSLPSIHGTKLASHMLFGACRSVVSRNWDGWQVLWFLNVFIRSEVSVARHLLWKNCIARGNTFDSETCILVMSQRINLTEEPRLSPPN